MPRRPVTNRNIVKPDSKYGSTKVARFINYVMLDGKKETARKVVYSALDLLKSKHSAEDPLETFNNALKNVGPTVEVRSRRIGGANYQVPREVKPERRMALAMRWMLEVVRSKKGVPTHEALADELFAASNGEGEAIKKRENTHRMAEANKAFAHFSW